MLISELDRFTHWIIKTFNNTVTGNMYKKEKAFLL